MTEQEPPDQKPGDAQMGDEEQAYTQAAVRGSAWGFIQTVVSNGFKQIVFLILAWVVMPSDFGLFGIAFATVNVLMIFSPLPLTDLLVQRRERMGRAIPNVMRIAGVGAVLMVPLIGGAAWLEGVRHGQSMEMAGEMTAAPGTLISELAGTPSLETLIDGADGNYELRLDEDWVEVVLPGTIEEGMTVGDFVVAMQSGVSDAAGAGRVVVSLDESGRILIRDGASGESVPVRTWSSADGLVLYALGLSYRSMTLTLLLLLFALLPLVLLFKLPLEPLLRLQLRFKEIAGAYFLGTVGSGIMAVTLGLLGVGAVALLMNHVLMPLLAGVVMAMIIGRRKPVPRGEREPTRPLLRDGLMLWTAQWVHTGGNALPLFVLSFHHSSDGIGYYVFALSVSVQIIALLSWNLSHAFTPIFSRIQDEPERLVSAYMRSAGAVTGITIPAMIMTGALAPAFFPMLFPETLAPAIPLLMILLLSQSFASSAPVSQSLLKGSGRNRAWLLWQAIQNGLFVVPILIVGREGSITDMALLVLATQLIAGPLGVAICAGRHASLLRILKVHWIPIIACTPMFAAAYVSVNIGPSWTSLLVWCPLAAIVCLIGYILALRALDRSRHDEFTRLLGQVMAKIGRKTG